MSDLPRYTRSPHADADASETEALVKGGRSSFEPVEDERAPSYPPRAGGPSGSKRNVNYEYDPVYPRKGSHSRVLGVLGRDKEETIQLVRKVFPNLEDISDDRISFKASFGDGTPNWSKLMDEVWPQFVDDPPTRMAVIVEDAPGEKKLRNRRDLKIFGTIFFCFATFMATVVTISIKSAPDETRGQ